MSLPVIVLGAGGHAKVLIEALLASSAVITGIVDPDQTLLGTKLFGVPVLGGDEVLSEFPSSEVLLVNGLGSIGLPIRRRKLFEKFINLGYNFSTVVHPSAIVASDVTLCDGSQIMAGVVIQPGTRIGSNVLINTMASVDHDCFIGDHTHVAPGVTLSGSITVGALSHIGTGATVIQGICIGEGSLVGAGALVLRDLPSGATAVGVPARLIRK